MHRYCSLIVLCLLQFTVHAQRHFMNGFLQDSITHFAIRGAKISNTINNKNVYSDQKGFFTIEAAPDDIIIVSNEGYRSSKIALSPLFVDTVTVYLVPTSKVLPTVSVSSRYNQYQNDSINRKKEFEQMRGGRLSNLSRADGFGITMNLDRLFKKRYKYQRQNEKRFSQREKETYIAYRFSPQLVAYYTGLKGQELQNFMDRHSPSYEWLRKHQTDEEVFYYINDQLKLFRGGAK